MGFSQADIDKTVLGALDTLNYDFRGKTDLIVIKPNLCYYWDYSTGETTDPRVVSAVIAWIRQKAGNDANIVIAEADASAMRTKYAFKMLGYEKLSLEKNVGLCNLSEGEIVDKEVWVAGEKFILPVNKLLLDADLLINVPKMKIHRTVGFTCALKNMFGAIAKPRKYVYHSKLAQTIVGINKIIKTNIVLVDGLIALGKTPKKIGAIIAGNDALATDLVVAKAMGCKPSGIGYLKLAIKEKIGDADSIDLKENPFRLEDIRKEFPKLNYRFLKLSRKLQLKLVTLYSKMSNDVIPPVLNGEG
jgi:uncharacterized protein (DUF362 family)